MKSGGAILNGPDAADKINKSIVIYNLQVLCLRVSVEEVLDHQPVEAQTQVIHIQLQPVLTQTQYSRLQQILKQTQCWQLSKY